MNKTLIQAFREFKTANNIVKLFYIILVSSAKQNMAVIEEDQKIALNSHLRSFGRQSFLDIGIFCTR